MEWEFEVLGPDLRKILCEVITLTLFYFFSPVLNLNRLTVLQSTEAVVRSCSVKKVFLEISQNLQKNTCARVSFLVNLQASGLQLY